MMQIKEELFRLLGVGVGEGGTKVSERKLCGPWPLFFFIPPPPRLIFILMEMETKRRRKGYFPLSHNGSLESPGGILTIIPPRSLGCRDPVNMISRHGMQKIFHSTGCREDV